MQFTHEKSEKCTQDIDAILADSKSKISKSTFNRLKHNLANIKISTPKENKYMRHVDAHLRKRLESSPQHQTLFESVHCLIYIHLVPKFYTEDLTLLQRMLKLRDDAIAGLLVIYGVDINALDKHGNGFLHLAVKAGDFEMVRYLIEKCKISVSRAAFPYYNNLNEILAVVPAESEHGRTALHLAVKANFPSIMMYLLSHNADINAQDAARDTPLHIAVREGHLELVNLFLLCGARPNIKNGYPGFGGRRTALELATEGSVIWKLLKNFSVDHERAAAIREIVQSNALTEGNLVISALQSIISGYAALLPPEEEVEEVEEDSEEDEEDEEEYELEQAEQGNDEDEEEHELEQGNEVDEEQQEAEQESEVAEEKQEQKQAALGERESTILTELAEEGVLGFARDRLKAQELFEKTKDEVLKEQLEASIAESEDSVLRIISLLYNPDGCIAYWERLKEQGKLSDLELIPRPSKLLNVHLNKILLNYNVHLNKILLNYAKPGVTERAEVELDGAVRLSSPSSTPLNSTSSNLSSSIVGSTQEPLEAKGEQPISNATCINSVGVLAEGRKALEAEKPKEGETEKPKDEHLSSSKAGLD